MSEQVFSILLADDNPVSLKPVVSILESRGHQVKVAENGQLAIDAMKDQAYDIILMDCNMPVMDGFEAARAIREYERSSQKKRIPIIALTNMDGLNAEKMCEEAGMDAHIAKPITVKAIDAILENLKNRS